MQLENAEILGKADLSLKNSLCCGKKQSQKDNAAAVIIFTNSFMKARRKFQAEGFQ